MKFRLFLITLTLLFSFCRQSFACTAFCLLNDNEIYLSKNLDWSIDEGFLFLNERGISKTVFNPKLLSGKFCWQSKYRSITFNQFGKEFPLGGMNEHGLVVEELNMVQVRLTADSKKYYISEFQLVQYLLDNCQTVIEVSQELNKFQYTPLLLYLHYLIADKSGNIMVVEFNGKNFNTFYPNETGVPVLSNNNYTESLKYLTNFEGFGGRLPVKNRKGSNERFVSATAMLAKYALQNPAKYCFHILDALKQNDTKWSIVYDINNLIIKFKFHTCDTIKTFDFSKLNQLSFTLGTGCDISDCAILSISSLKTISKKENSLKVQKVFTKLAMELKTTNNFKLSNLMAEYGNQFLPDLGNTDTGIN